MQVGKERFAEKRLLKAGFTVMALALTAAMAGCGSDDWMNKSAGMSGTAIDGYLGSAQVCLDLNDDGACSTDEPSATTDSQGRFSLEATPAQFAAHSILVVATAGQTTDSDNPGAPVTAGFTLSSPPGLTDAAGNTTVTPITTVLDKERAQNPGQSTDDLVATSPTAASLCGHTGDTADMKACLTADHVADANSTDTNTRVTAQRKQLVARVLTKVIADAQQQAASDPLGETTEAKRSTDAALVNRAVVIVEKVDDALMNANGDAQAVDTTAIADQNGLVGNGGLKSLINASQADTTTVLGTKVFETSQHRYKLSDTTLARDSVTRGHYYGFGSWSNDGHTFTKDAGFDGAGFSRRDSGYESGSVKFRSVADYFEMFSESYIGSGNVKSVVAGNAKRLALADRSVAGVLDQYAPGKGRSWHDVLAPCTKFDADAVGHLVRTAADSAEVRVPAVAYYGIIPASVIPATDGSVILAAFAPPIDTVIDNFTASIGPFTVYVGPDLAVVLANGEATFKDGSSGATLGKTTYGDGYVKSFLGMVKVVTISDFSLVGERELYFSRVAGDAIGIAVARDTSLASYNPKYAVGTPVETTGYGVGVFAYHDHLVERLFLNDSAANQVEQALDAAALSAGTERAATECNYTVAIANPPAGNGGTADSGAGDNGGGTSGGGTSGGGSSEGGSSEGGTTGGGTSGGGASDDRDGDGTPNASDRFPDDPTESADLDDDGIGDNADTDRDGDSVDNAQDLFPNDPTESADLDSDGIGDNADTDRDGDNVDNAQDAFPNDPTESADSDGDGVGDNSDAFPADPNESQDADMDGVGDNADPAPNDPNIPLGPGGGGGEPCDPADPNYPACI